VNSAHTAFTIDTERTGKARKMSSTFVFLRLRPASLVHHRAVGFDETCPCGG
jgi:hypothetical protein